MMLKEESKNATSKSLIVPPGLLKKMFEFHSLIATCEGAPILLTGPTGVGKSLFIHMFKEWFKKNQGVNEKNINTINCSHFDKPLLRSELFGHEKGAFTDAKAAKEGWIEKSKGGVLILEEIGELPLDCQAQLLTFIEDGKYHRVGSTEIKESGHIPILG
ncbi:MAG: sigma 54-interacting transcriptional regulator, partial [Smithella sp.]